MKDSLTGPIKWHKTRWPWIESGIHLAHGKNGSSLILKEDVSWITISGLLFVFRRRYMLWIYWRNWG